VVPKYDNGYEDETDFVVPKYDNGYEDETDLWFRNMTTDMTADRGRISVSSWNPVSYFPRPQKAVESGTFIYGKLRTPDLAIRSAKFTLQVKFTVPGTTCKVNFALRT